MVEELLDHVSISQTETKELDFHFLVGGSAIRINVKSALHLPLAETSTYLSYKLDIISFTRKY